MTSPDIIPYTIEELVVAMNGIILHSDAEVAKMNNCAFARACSTNDYDAVQKLIEKGININTASSRGQTPLHIASSNGRLNIVKILIDNGANINAQDINGYTALHHSSENYHYDVAKLLIANGADVNIASKFGTSVLGKVVNHVKCPYDFIELLIASGADINSKTSYGGGTALHFASSKNRIDIVKFLVKHGANVNMQNNELKTPQQLTTNPEIIEFLTAQKS